MLYKEKNCTQRGIDIKEDKMVSEGDLTCPFYENSAAREITKKAIDKIKNGNIKKTKLIWLELTGCSGNIISLLDSSFPDIKYIITQMVDIVFQNSLMTAEGEEAMEKLFSMKGKEYILAAEGSAAIKDNGLYNVIGSYKGKAVTASDAVRIFGEGAKEVIAVGACAVHGGVSAGRPNPSESVSVQSLLKRKVINLPGCPCHPDWFTGTLAHIILYGTPALDKKDRPLMFYSTLIHDRCQRRSFFDRGIFAEKPGDETCMFKLGCRGPVTRIDCPIRKWNSHQNYPIEDDTPCIGCAQFGFPDAMEPFITYNTTRGE